MELFGFTKLNRYKKILFTLAKYGFEDIVARLEGLYPFKIPIKRQKKEFPQNTFTRIRLVLEELGPTFVKFGQVLSLRTDLIPVELANELSQLQDMVEGEPFEKIVEQIKRSLKKDIDLIFTHIDPTPLAAGSLAQVHIGILKHENTTVAIKVQRPHIKHIIKADLKILEEISIVLHNRIEFIKVYSLPEIINELKKMILNELDFKREVRNITIAKHNLSDDDRFYLPRIFPEYCSNEIITMERLDGCSLKESLPQMTNEQRKETAHSLLDILLKQILEHGFFHADPHPGNIFILNNKKISLLDWGMVGRLSPSIRFKLIDLVQGIVKKDIEQVVEVILFLCYSSKNVDLLSLSMSLQDFIDEYYALPLKDIHMGKMLLDITNILHKHQMRIRPEIAVLIKAIVTSEGSGRLLYPEIDVISEVRPYIKKITLQKLSPVNVYLEIKKGLSTLILFQKEIPKKIDRILDKIEKDELSIGFEHKNLENLRKTLDRITNRLVLGILTAAMIIGSSMIITTKIPPLLFGYPAIGLVGYLCSAVFGSWIIIDILRKKKF